MRMPKKKKKKKIVLYHNLNSMTLNRQIERTVQVQHIIIYLSSRMNLKPNQDETAFLSLSLSNW